MRRLDSPGEAACDEENCADGDDDAYHVDHAVTLGQAPPIGNVVDESLACDGCQRRLRSRGRLR